MSLPPVHDDEGYIDPFDEAVTLAKAQGFEVIYGSPKTLLLDLDGEGSALRFEAQLPRMSRIIAGLKVERKWRSKSGCGLHVVLSVTDELSVERRLFYQACLGSDPVRESLGLTRFAAGIKEPIMLFKPKEAQS